MPSIIHLVEMSRRNSRCKFFCSTGHSGIGFSLTEQKSVSLEVINVGITIFKLDWSDKWFAQEKLLLLLTQMIYDCNCWSKLQRGREIWYILSLFLFSEDLYMGENLNLVWSSS